MPTNPNDSAFPYPAQRTKDGEPLVPPGYGLTVRQEFAKAAMQGFCANSRLLPEELARIPVFAVEQADGLIAWLNETEQDG